MGSSFLPPLIHGWDPNPFPNLSLSAAGLLVLADLHTIAQRTAITGGSTWLDALVLAPGLHYQQAADELEREGAAGSGGGGLFAELVSAQSSQDTPVTSGSRDGDDDAGRVLPGEAFAEIERRRGGSVSEKFAIKNAATLNFLRRLHKDRRGAVVTLDVKSLVAAKKAGYSLSRSMSDLLRRTSKAVTENEESKLDAAVSDLGHVLFLATPVLTVSSITFSVLLGDWWCLSIIVALMISRLLNIWAIKQRSRSDPTEMEDPRNKLGSTKADAHAEYTINLGNGKKVVLKGTQQDLQAVTTQAWMRNKTSVEGFLEAAAKLIVYLIAAFSGNMSQAGSILLMALLLLSAACLGLSNAQAQGFEMHGRVARPEKTRGDGAKNQHIIDGNRAIRLSEDHQAGLEQQRELEEQNQMATDAGMQPQPLPVHELNRTP